jgi:hypothetical protein
LEGTSVIGDGALHREALVGTNREGHGSLAGRRILGVLLRKAQDVQQGNTGSMEFLCNYGIIFCTTSPSSR